MIMQHGDQLELPLPLPTTPMDPEAHILDIQLDVLVRREDGSVLGGITLQENVPAHSLSAVRELWSKLEAALVARGWA